MDLDRLRVEARAPEARLDRPRVVWPAPGRPALFAGEDRGFAVLVAHAGWASDDVRAWARGLSLRDPDGGEGSPLLVRAVEEVPRGRAPDEIRDLADLPLARRWRYHRLAVEASRALAPRAPRTATVFDLEDGHGGVRRGAVGALSDPSRRLRLAVASDLHVADLFDDLLAAVRRADPVGASALLDPRDQVERFVARANALAARGELDLVVLCGDLVDHVHPAGGGSEADRHPAPTNVHRLLDLLAGLRVPRFVVPGNHDHRLHPWRARTYGLLPLGMPRSRLRGLLRAAGSWSGAVVAREDLRALATAYADGGSGLAHHLLEHAPSTDYAVDVGALRLVFASTGRDVLGRWREVEVPRRALFVRGLRTAWSCPASEGLYDAQLARIRRHLDGARAAAVFVHAPAVCGADARPVALRLDPRSLAADARASARVAFERRLSRAGLCGGAFFRNAGPFLGALASASGPVAGFSGHVHGAQAFALDRSDLSLRGVELRAPDDPSRAVFLATLPPLGQVVRAGGGGPGFVLARFDDGRLASVEREEVGPGAGT